MPFDVKPKLIRDRDADLPGLGICEALEHAGQSLNRARRTPAAAWPKPSDASWDDGQSG